MARWQQRVQDEQKRQQVMSHFLGHNFSIFPAQFLHCHIFLKNVYIFNGFLSPKIYFLNKDKYSEELLELKKF